MIKKIVLLLVLYFIFLYIYTWRNILVLKDITYPEKNLYKDEIKTGDIFLLGNKKKQRIFGDSIFMIKFVHPSIAVWEDSNLYMVEFAIYPDKEGLIKIPFHQWLTYNKNKRILRSALEIDNETPEHRKKIKDNILSYYENNKKKINSIDRNFNLTWLRFPLRIKRELDIDNISCTEVLAKIIDVSGIAKKDKGSSYYHQSDFISLSGFILNNKFSYPNNYLCKFQHLMKKYI
tara:strand:+ start:12502 stop:13200 length:699 start_codon:yes stop_codon:yes gene_type:complete